MKPIRLWTAASEDVLRKFTFPTLPASSIDGVFCPQDHGGVPPLGDAVVLAMGKEPVEALQAAGVLPKNRTIGSLRQKPVQVNGAAVLVTYNPAICLSDPTKQADLEWDQQLAVRLARTGSMDPEVGAYIYVDDLDEVCNYLQSIDEAIPIAVDLETLGLDPYADNAWIVSFQVSICVEHAHVVRFRGPDDPRYPTNNPALLEQIRYILTSDRVRVRGASFKFDLLWMYVHWGIECTNFTMDTTLVGSLLDENRSNSLNNHAKAYTSMGGYDDHLNQHHDKSRMDLVPDDEFLVYAGGDTDACLRASNRMVSQLCRSKRLARFYQHLLHPAMLAFHDMERIGVCVDVDYFKKLETDLQAHADSLEKQAFALLPRRLKIKHRNQFSLSRSKITVDFLFSKTGLGLEPVMVTEKTKAPSTSHIHLQEFQDHPEAGQWVRLLDEHSQTTKTLGTYVTGFLSHLRSDGRFHPTAMLFKGAYEASRQKGEDISGTVTGRTAFRDPAIQTLPKHTRWAKALRSAYIAPPGYRIVLLDYSQGELRICACVANEPRMIAAYKNGIDLHVLTGASLLGWDPEIMFKLGKSEDPKDQETYALVRQNGKSANFGLIYGIGAFGYVAYAWATYGLRLTPQQGGDHKQKFFDEYPGLEIWHAQYKNFAHNHGYVESPLGRKRHLPLINAYDPEVQSRSERQAINSPIQSTLSDLALYALGEFRNRYGCPVDCMPFVMIHDAVGFYVKEDKLDDWVPRIRSCMEEIPLAEKFGWSPQLPFPTDWEMGTNMAEMVKQK